MAQTVGTGGNNRVFQGGVQSVKSLGGPTMTARGAKNLPPMTFASLTPRPIAPPPPPPPAPAPQINMGDIGGDVGGQTFTSMLSPMPTEEQFLAGDKTYQDQLAALLAALDNYGTEQTRQKSNYDTDFINALDTLGLRDSDRSAETANDRVWQGKDLNTSFGRGTQSIQNDFASRGMLQSSGFARAQDDLMRSLMDQVASMDTGRQRFTDDLGAQRSAFEANNKTGQQDAREAALQRRALQFMSV